VQAAHRKEIFIENGVMGFVPNLGKDAAAGVNAARKPIFLLKPADGAIGAHVEAVHRSYLDFEQLTERIIAACGVPVETPSIDNE